MRQYINIILSELSYTLCSQSGRWIQMTPTSLPVSTFPCRSEASQDNQCEVVRIKYTNYRGETAIRRIVPGQLRFGASEWHPEPQWLLDALDIDRGVTRSFAMKDILAWGVEL
jgi:hypothetical protein